MRERGGDSLDGGDVRAAVSPKEEKREGKGVRCGSEGGDREPTGYQEKGKCIVHEHGGCNIMSWLCEDRVLVVPHTDDVHRACCNSDLACVVRVS